MEISRERKKLLAVRKCPGPESRPLKMFLRKFGARRRKCNRNSTDCSRVKKKESQKVSFPLIRTCSILITPSHLRTFKT